MDEGTYTFCIGVVNSEMQKSSAHAELVQISKYWAFVLSAHGFPD